MAKNRWIISVAAAALTVTLVSGCSSGGDKAADSTTSVTTTSSSSSTSTSTASTSTTTAPTTTTANGPGGETTPGLGSLPAGFHYGYFTGITTGKVENQTVSVVGFDKVEFLTGDAAVAAAKAHGDIPPDATSVDNDYYIVNDNKLIRKLPVIPDGQVSIVEGGTPEQKPSGIEEAVNTPGLYKIQIVVVRGISLITSTEGVFLP